MKHSLASRSSIGCALLALFAGVACSGSSDDAGGGKGKEDASIPGDGGDGGVAGSGGGGGQNDSGPNDSGHDSAPSTGWSLVASPAELRLYRLAGDARGVWASGDRHVSGGRVFEAGRLSEGGFEGVYEKHSSDTVAPNFFIQALAPVGARTAVIGGQMFVLIIGEGEPRAVTSVTSDAKTAFAFSDRDVWISTRHGSLTHFNGTTDDRSRGLADSGDVQAMWGTSGMLFFATTEGLRGVSLPIPLGWNEPSTEELSGSFADVDGALSVGFAVGDAGIAGRYEGGSWTSIPTGTTVDLTAVAVASGDNAWAAGERTLLHWDGSRFTQVQEEGMPTGEITDLAAEPDGTLWLAASGQVYRRRP
ncbi:MAG: hypothetical protein KF915_18680 [Polyangiaceae bacterium]|nr:hypothetical protein [Polyangiaceae bacterium]